MRERGEERCRCGGEEEEEGGGRRGEEGGEEECVGVWWQVFEDAES